MSFGNFFTAFNTSLHSTHFQISRCVVMSSTASWKTTTGLVCTFKSINFLPLQCLPKHDHHKVLVMWVTSSSESLGNFQVLKQLQHLRWTFKNLQNWEKTSLISYPSLYILVDAQEVLNLKCNSAAEKDSKEGRLRSLSHTCKKATSRPPNHKQECLWKPVPMYFRQKKTQDLEHRSILPISRRRGKMNHCSTSSSLLIQQKDYRFR